MRKGVEACLTKSGFAIFQCGAEYFLFRFLKKLCEFNCVGEELIRKDDLFLLFAGASCSCPAENVEWREAVSQLLVVVVSRSLSSSVTKYIHGIVYYSLKLSDVPVTFTT